MMAAWCLIRLSDHHCLRVSRNCWHSGKEKIVKEVCPLIKKEALLCLMFFKDNALFLSNRKIFEQ